MDFRYYLGTAGLEIAHLQKLAAKLDLVQEVIFGEKKTEVHGQQGLPVPGSAPSLKETRSNTLLPERNYRRKTHMGNSIMEGDAE